MTLKNVEKLEKSRVKLTIEVSSEELEEGKAAAFKKMRKTITVPGFRKGKAPRKMIESLYGAGIFFEEAVNISYPKAYEAAVEEADIRPVGMADIDVTDIQEDSYTFDAIVPVEPEVTISKYKGISAEKKEVKVTEDDIKAELDRLANRAITTETVDRASIMGDTLNIDFEGFVDGKAFEGGKGEKFDLRLGSKTFIPGFEDQLVGYKAGDEADVNVVFPEDYHSEDLKGKPAVFKCKIHEVKATTMPEFDDEFAKDVSEFETMDELEKDIEKMITNSREQAYTREFEETISDALVSSLEGEIPDAMYENQIDRMVEDFSYRIQVQGVSLDQYLKMNNMDMPTFRQLFREQAERQVKVRLALKKIAELEKLEVTPEEIEAEYEKMAKNYGLDMEKVREYAPADALSPDLLVNKAMEFVKANAKLKKKTTRKAAEKKEPAEKKDAAEKKTAKKPAEKKTATKKTAAKKEKSETPEK